MSKLKFAGPALLCAAFLLPSFAQDSTASLFAKQVERDVAALSIQTTLGDWHKLHPDEELELMHYNPGKNHYETDLRLDFDSWCAGSLSQSPANFGRVTLFFLPGVTAAALPPLPEPGMASIKESCQMQAVHYTASSQIPIEDLIRELSTVWGTPDRSHAVSGAQYGRPLNLYGDIATWNNDGISARLSYLYTIEGAVTDQRTGIMLYAKRDALPTAPCFECTSTLMYPFTESLTQFLQEAATIAAEDPALTRQIVAWSGRVNETIWKKRAVDPTLARRNLREWLDAAKHAPAHQRAAALLLADLYIGSTVLDSVAKPDQPYELPPDFYKGLGAEYDKDGNYVHNFLKQADKLDEGGEISELAALWIASDSCPATLWPDSAIERGDDFLRRFPADRWTPYVHYALARAHGAKLLWTYPGGSGDDPGEVIPLSPGAKERERGAAVEHYRTFLDTRPVGRSAAFAWIEAWRLLAGLPPSEIRWGCNGLE